MAAELGLPAGYDFDSVNSDVLLHRMRVRNGKLTLPDGLSYEVLVLPDRPDMDVEVLERLDQLVREGATVWGPRPRRATSLKGYPACDARVRERASRLWEKIHWDVSLSELLRKRGVEPDFLCRLDLDYLHRRDGARDIYFVRNKREEWAEAECVFRARGAAEWWDPVTGTRRPLASHDGRVALSLPPLGSGFVVFDRAAPENKEGSNLHRLTPVMEISGPWEVRFDGNAATFPHLLSWTERPEPEIKYFSGIATYHKDLDLPRDRRRLFVDLGDVRVIARVRLNGQEAGIVWTRPFQIEITSLARPGANRLEVEVANTWSNRLTGQTLGEVPPVARTNARWSKTTPLLPSGLLGPVHLSTT
jgi:hypothetical protein